MKYSLWANLGWTTAYSKQHVVYRLHWDGKPYIGSTCNLSARMYWWRADAKVEGRAVTIEVLSLHTDADTRLAEEARLVKKYLGRSHNKTLDGKAGGVLGHTMSDTAKSKVSLANTGKKRTEATKKLQSQLKLGKSLTAEHRAAIGVSRLGHEVTAETRAAISAGNKGKPKSDSHRAALKAAWERRRNLHQTALGH